jgi:predicted nucleotidyltransferase component of viral defense system
MTGRRDRRAQASNSRNDPGRSIGLRPDDQERVQRQFGVSAEQVRRDHLISHLLGALSAMRERRNLTFFGGTALSRTLLVDLRLSEDIDLITTGSRSQMATAIIETFESALARTHGEVHWAPSLAQTTGAEPAVLRVEGPTQVQIQLIAAEGYPPWPTEVVDLEQRYSDAPPARLAVLTRPASVAAKASAWHSRRASRDLYDLWALNREGLIDQAAQDLYVRFGPTGQPPSDHEFETVPGQDDWDNALAHQGRIQVGPDEAAAAIKRAWQKLRKG